VDTVVVGSFTPSILLDVAVATGHLDGMPVREVPVTSSPAQFRSLLDDELAIALTSPDNVLAYRYSPHNPLRELADVRIVGAVDRGLGLGLYARPGLGAGGLHGARVGVDVPGSGFALALYALAEQLGATRDDYELVTLGSTPRRLESLLTGECDATMLNAGNELVAEDAGCVRLAGVEDVANPYLGTVVAVAGERQLGTALELSAGLTTTAAAIVAGDLGPEVVEAAGRRLGLTATLAERYLDRLRDPVRGLVADGRVDEASVAHLIGLRSTYLPEPSGDGDVLDAALGDRALVHGGLR
jgi:ABC-type nitrate/sulfonate/bicarbonate transport system substrate-binding protein